MEAENKGPELEADSRGDVSTMAGNHKFRVAIKKGALSATPTYNSKKNILL